MLLHIEYPQAFAQRCRKTIVRGVSPALGFDYVQRKVVLFGDGALLTWVSYRDAAEFAARSQSDVGGGVDCATAQHWRARPVRRQFEKRRGRTGLYVS